jgi:cell division protein FtsI (penicillin-binding protein 3)
MAEQDSNNKKIIAYYLVVAVFFILFAALIFGKACMVSFVEGSDWRKLGEKQVRPSEQVPATRGNIYSRDKDGKLLLMATNEEYYRLYLDFWAKGVNADTLRKYVRPLSIELNKLFPKRSAAEYEQHIMNGWHKRSPKNREYRLFDHPVNYLELKAIRRMPFFKKGRNASGLYTNRTPLSKRTKPYGTLASRTIGDIYASADSTRKAGKNGLELHYDSLLRGQPGLSDRQKVNGKWIQISKINPIKGKDIISTIDVDIQDITEKALLNRLRELDAESATAVVMATATGEIKAITNMGRIREGEWAEVKNYAVSDLSEPGSTFKVVSMMVALEDGTIRPDDPVDTGNGKAIIAGIEMTDHNYKNDGSGGYGLITAAKSIRYSSNIGLSRLIEKAYDNNPSRYVEGIYKIGFHKDMHLEIPGYGVPRIKHPKDPKPQYWAASDLTRMSYGYVTQIPPIYTLSFFNAIANDGKLIKPIFVREIQEGKEIERKKTEVINPSICSPTTLSQIRQMLDDVVNCSDGTGKPARSTQVRIAGKTGTAKLTRNGVYDGTHQVSFCGYFPADHPQYSIIVVIRRPRIGQPSGGIMSGPVFKTIAEEIYARNIITNTKDFPIDTIHSKEIKVKTVYEDLETTSGLVPNVKGMGARNAVYALEKAGLRVHLEGRGTVYSQSIKEGNTVVRRQTITLKLK